MRYQAPNSHLKLNSGGSRCRFKPEEGATEIQEPACGTGFEPRSLKEGSPEKYQCPTSWIKLSGMVETTCGQNSCIKFGNCMLQVHVSITPMTGRSYHPLLGN